MRVAGATALGHHRAMIVDTRVRLRRVERDDLPRFVAWLNDPEVRRSLALLWPMGSAQEEAWYEAQLKAEPALQAFSIDVRKDASAWTHAGGAGFHSVDWVSRAAELGLVIGDKSRWGQGYGTEATRALCRWGLRELNLHRIWLRVYEDNAPAIRSYEKVGFKLEGRLRQDRFREGRYLDTLVMGLLYDELTE